MTSLWLDRSAPLPDDPLPHDEVLDDLVVGAGLTGLTTALLLARSGRRVAVVEARAAGSLTTGNSTAKVSLLQGTHLSRILRLRPESDARSYLEANRAGMEWLLEFCETHGVPVQRRPAVTYAASESEVPSMEQEHEAASTLGLGVRRVDGFDVPFPTHGGTELPDQAQLDPMQVLTALVEQLRAHGGTLHQHHRVRGVSTRPRPAIHLDDGVILTASNVVLATGTPILDRGLHFARVEPQRSYGLAFVEVDAPEAMFLSAGSDSRSVREAPGRDGERPLLLVGGAGHTVGRTDSEQQHVDRLRAWTTKHFPGATETHVWSAQDYGSFDGLPQIDTIRGTDGRVLVATGYDKWGMTNAVAAARTISGRILGRAPSWATVLTSRVPRAGGATQLARMNGGVAVSLLGGLGRLVAGAPPSVPDEGGGGVGHDGLVPEGRATVDGRTCRVVALCTHLGGALKWNDLERSWDCPLHGSRFGLEGEVLEGPATRPLRTRAVSPTGP